MKKIIKIIKNNMIGFTVGVVIAIAISTYAATQLASGSVYYDNTTSGGSSNTVSGALDELYNMAKTHCPDGYICTEKPKLCKRATKLHTETCSQTSTSYYCQADGYAEGDTITYGNLGEDGALASGDAFDCDVNGDGTYDAQTERFYYVSDMTNGVTSDSDTAVLIYYNNVSGGEPNNSTTYAYNTNSSGYLGPQTAVTQLPTASQWSNVNLKETSRDITDEKGTIRVTGFSYNDYAARLLTTQEMEQGCGFTVGSLSYGELSSKCKYLMENTKYSSSTLGTYGTWLETPYSIISDRAWEVFGLHRFVDYCGVSVKNTDGVRPAIEVPKSDISY